MKNIMLFSSKKIKLKSKFKISILTALLLISILSIFINTQFMNEFPKLQIETTRFSSENIGPTDLLSISQFYLCQESAQISSDGTGGAIMVWDDDRGSDCDIYAQRVNSTGDVQWAANGVAICTGDEGQYKPQISSDGTGNAIITWLDDRDAVDSYDWDIYAQRVDSTGDVQWITNGVPICTVSGSKVEPQICSDSTGGAIITWVDSRSTNNSVYGQSVNSSGDLQWAANGVPISTTTGYMGTVQICSDGTDGVIITWQDERSFGNRDIYAQRINSTGDVLWTTNGEAICVANGYQGFPQICSDGLNGAIITWRDQRLGPSHIYAQRINSSGKVQWTANGEVISVASDVQTDQQICSDGFNGAYITWHTWVFNASFESDIYAQRVNSSGNVKWTANGVAICTASGRQIEPQISGGGSGNAIITWLDGGYGYEDIYAQCVNSTGDIKWLTNGVPICTKSSSELEPRICSDGTNGAIILWQDERYVEPSIYAQRINSIGDVQWLANGVAIRTFGEGSSGQVPGYNLLFLLGILTVVAILISRKIKKS